MRSLSDVKRAVIFLTLLALVVGQVILPGGWAQGPGALVRTQAYIALEPPSLTLAVGEEAWITISVYFVTNLYGADVQFEFIPAVIEGVGNLETGTVPYPDFVIRNEINNTAGTIWYAVTQTNPREPFSGSGTMARIRVRGKSAGVTNLRFTNSQLATRDGDVIPVNTSDAQITVGGGAPTSTHTPSATVTPSETSTSTPTPSTTVTPSPSSTLTPGPSPTSSATPSITPTPSPSVTFTPGPSPTPSATPSVTQTPTAGPSPTPSATPSITPTSFRRTFSGNVYRGNLGDTSDPLSGVQIQLWGSNTSDHPGTFVTSDETDADGAFYIVYDGSYPHCSLMEMVPSGYRSAGAIPGPGGRLGDSSGTWVQYVNAAPGDYTGTQFFLLRESTATPTATGTRGTPSPTSTGTVATPTSVGTPTPSFTPPPSGPQYFEVRAEKDTYLDLENPTENYGRDGSLKFGYAQAGPIKVSLVEFDLARLPRGALVQEAKMRLFGRNVWGGGDYDLQAFGLLRTWEELQTNWRYAMTGLAWAREGAQGPNTDRDTDGPIAEFYSTPRYQYYEWDLTALVQEWASGRVNQGVLVMGTGGQLFGQLGLYSSDYSEAEMHPLLAVTFLWPTATPTPTATRTPTATPTLTRTPTPTSTATPTLAARGLYLPLLRR